jgi:hypothetical protein
MSFSVRFSEDKKYVSVYDVLEALSGSKKKTADKAFERLNADLKDLCRLRLFAGDKQTSRAASLAVIIDIIKKVGGKATKEKRKNLIDFLIKCMGQYTDHDDFLMKPHNEKQQEEEKKVDIAYYKSQDLKDEKLRKTSCKRKSPHKEKEALENQHLQRMLDMEYNLQVKKVKIEEDRLQMQKDLYTHDFHLYTKLQDKKTDLEMEHVEYENQHKKKMLQLELEQRMKTNEENLKIARIQSIIHLLQTVSDAQIKDFLKKKLCSCLVKDL